MACSRRGQERAALAAPELRTAMLASDMKSSPLSPNFLEVCLEAQILSVQRKASLSHVLRNADPIPPYGGSNPLTPATQSRYLGYLRAQGKTTGIPRVCRGRLYAETEALTFSSNLVR